MLQRQRRRVSVALRRFQVSLRRGFSVPTSLAIVGVAFAVIAASHVSDAMAEGVLAFFALLFAVGIQAARASGRR